MKKINKKTHLTGKARKGFKLYISLILAVVIICTLAVTAFAADDPLKAVDNLSTFIFGLIRAVGLIILGFGVVQVGLSLKSHDPSQRANGFLTVAGGIVITFAKAILDIIVK
ncbi:MAG: glutamyl-tRNA amidotransferase [Faecalibacterium sp.]|nr:glutamyl-tRNA amidotransferase [Ruminococcus flavefaciens]MCM1393126.1 glutamyl-tRNA amidotransferase [Ruminococcus sp.]MCM1484632.1 glutamyl-tRNA amidotransferase [Faecalibacterium sp.]